MNAWQMSRQIAHLLAAQTWPDGAAEVVFAAVRVLPALEGPALDELRMPVALVVPGDATSDDEEPQVMRHSFEVLLAQAIAGDSLGERAIIGSNREAVGKSYGRGVLELEEEALRALDRLNRTDGVRLWVASTGSAGAAVVDGLGFVATRSVRFEATVTRGRFYHPVTGMTAVDAAGAGDCDIAWSDAPDRFDTLDAEGVMIRRAAGAVAPATTTAGTLVAEKDVGDLAHTDNPGAGTFSYSIFVAYDETGAGTKQRYSNPTSVTSVVVT